MSTTRKKSNPVTAVPRKTWIFRGRLGSKKGLAKWMSPVLVPRDVQYLCSPCARKAHAKWPRGHVATVHVGTCPMCSKIKALSCINDWIWPGQTKQEVWD